MFEVEARINNDKGIHARPSRDIVVSCRNYKSTVTLRRKTNPHIFPTNNILYILTAAFLQGEVIIVRAEGPDEVHAAKDIAYLIQNFKYC